jgi:hypothetical protein
MHENPENSRAQLPLPRHAMTHSVRTLLLAAVVFMASQAAPRTVAGDSEGQGAGVQVTRYVCVHCTQTGHLSSRGLFLSRAAVNRHIAHAKPCRQAAMGYREMPIQIRAVDVMAGGGGGAGPAPSIRHQEPGTKHAGTQILEYRPKLSSCNISAA